MTVAASIQGAVGFGANLLAAPLVALVDPELVPGPLLAGAIVLTVLMTIREPEGANLRELGWAYAGRLPGTLLGAIVLVSVPEDRLQLFFGLLILAAVAITASGLHLEPRAPTLAGAGVLSGFMATAVSIGGPPIALLYQHRPGGILRGTLARYLAIGSTISLLTLIAFGQFGVDDAVASLAVIPGVMIGFGASRYMTAHLDRGHTRTAVLVLSAVAAATALAKSVL